MNIKQIDYEASVKAGQYIFHEDKFWEIKDKPSVHEANGILSVYLDKNGMKGTFHGPNMMFGAPTSGNLIKVYMQSRKYAYFLITSWTQDFDICKGTISRLCYEEFFNNLITLAKVSKE